MTVDRVAPEAITSDFFHVQGQKSRWRYPDRHLTPEDCEELYNVNLSDQGSADSRLGMVLYNDTQITGEEAVVGIWEGDFRTTGTKRLVVTPTKVYSDDGTTRVDLTGGTDLTGDDDDRVRFLYLSNQVVLNNGVDQIRTWEGNDTIPVATADLAGVLWTSCRDMLVHKNMLLVMNTVEGGTRYPTRVRFCDINRDTFVVDITNWPIANRHEVYDGGTAIIGGVEAWGRALIFKEDGLYPGEIIFDDMGHYAFRVDQPLRGFSPVSKMSLVARPNFVFGAAREGVFVIDPSFNIQIVNSEDVTAWLALNKDRLEYAQAWVREEEHQVRLLCSSTLNTEGHDRVLVWDWETGNTWMDRPAFELNAAARVTLSGEEAELYGTTDGYVYQGNVGSYELDGTTSFGWRIKMHPNDLGLPGKSKHILNVRTFFRLRGSGAQVNMVLHIDGGNKGPKMRQLSMRGPHQWNEGSQWNSGLTWPGSGVRAADTWVNRVCESVAPEWYATTPATIEGYQVEYIPLEE